MEESTLFWKSVGVNHLMIKWSPEIPFIDANGQVSEKTFAKLESYQKKFKVEYHLHPYNLTAEGIYLSPSVEGAQEIFAKVLQKIDEYVVKYGLYPLITLHCPRMGNDKLSFKITEKEALKRAQDFYVHLNLKSKLVLETMHDPYRNPGHALLGYKPEHFDDLIKESNIGVCIDTGHLNMAAVGIKSFLNMKYELSTLHINGNRKNTDSHLIPTSETLDEYELLSGLVKKCKGPIVLEIKKHEGYEKELISKLVDTVQGMF